MSRVCLSCRDQHGLLFFMLHVNKIEKFYTNLFFFLNLKLKWYITKNHWCAPKFLCCTPYYLKKITGVQFNKMFTLISLCMICMKIDWCTYNSTWLLLIMSNILLLLYYYHCFFISVFYCYTIIIVQFWFLPIYYDCSHN